MFADPSFIPDALARRNFIRTNISRDLWETHSGADILWMLRGEGLGISTQDFYQLRREALGMIARPDVFDDVIDLGMIPRALFRDDHGFQLTLNALYRFTLVGVDLETGEEVTVTRAISSNNQLSVDAAYAQLAQFYPVGYEYEGIETTSVELMDALVMPGARLL